MRSPLLTSALLLVGLAATATGSAKHPVTIEDALALKAVGAVAIAPDGRAVLFALDQWESAGKDASEATSRKERRSRIWLVPTDAGATPGDARQLTFGERGETAPTWSPDGRWIAFLATRPDARQDRLRPQIWLMRAEGGEAFSLTRAREGVSSYAWAPDGSQIAFVTREPLSEAADNRVRQGDDPIFFEEDFPRAHVWIINVASGAATPLTRGTDFVLRGQPAWAPDGTRLAFAAAPTPMARDSRIDIYVLTLGSKTLEKITTNLGPDRLPAWSPDGATIAFVSDANQSTAGADGIPPTSVVNPGLVLYDVASKRLKVLALPQFDLGVGAPVWTPDGGRILFVAPRRAYREVFAYDVRAHQYIQLTRRHTISAISISHTVPRAALVMDSPGAPPDVYVADIAFASMRKLTSVNPQASEFELGESEVITWKSSDGLDVEGILLKPVGFEPGRRYPLLVNIHGGPGGSHQNGFLAYAGDAGQHWSGRGWAVLYPNPRGSRAYGEKFLRGNIPDWGGGDYRDIMAGVDAVVGRGIADPDKLAVMGYSYGGYLTCWMVTQTGRFRAAMMGSGISNLASMQGTTDDSNYLATFFNGSPSSATMPLYLERSGVTHAHRVTTPLLIIHGAIDDRVPIGQPLEFFRALKDRGRTVQLVFYPREGHSRWDWEYLHQLDRFRREYEWFSRYTLGAGTSTSRR